MRLLSGRVLLVAASIALFFGAITLYMRAAILDEREFADRATATLEDSEVRTVVSTRIVDEAIEQGSAELIQARPLLQASVSAALDTGRVPGGLQAGRAERPHARVRARPRFDRPRPGRRRHRRDQRAEGDRAEGREGRPARCGGRADRPERPPVRDEPPRHRRRHPLPRDRAAAARPRSLRRVGGRLERPPPSDRRGRHRGRRRRRPHRDRR